MAIVGLSFSILIFRIKREMDMAEKGETTWIAFSDWLVVIALLVAGLFVLVPLLATDAAGRGRLPISGLIFAIVMVLGWVPAILAHYRLILGRRRRGPRHNPEPMEAAIVVAVVLLSAAAFAVTYYLPRLLTR
jgi:uncharacterized BrkB/YihY/UPF0761 family membrane protein